MSVEHRSLDEQQSDIEALKADPTCKVIATSGRRPLLFVVDVDDAEVVASLGNLSARRAKNDYTAYVMVRSTGLHRVLVGVTSRQQQVDHRNGNGMDNRRENLRHATHSQNMGNRRKRVESSSRYKGVHRRQNGLWRATVANESMGDYLSEAAAAHAYDVGALARFGEFARVNGVPSTLPEPRRFKQPYDKETKSAAMRLALEYRNCARAARETGVDKAILKYWMHQAGHDITPWRNIRRPTPEQEQFKVDAIAWALECGNVAQAARDLGIKRPTLYKWVREARVLAPER